LDELDKVFDSFPETTFPDLSNRNLMSVPKQANVLHTSKKKTGLRKAENRSSAAHRFLEEA
jgi:hypothetical protein